MFTKLCTLEQVSHKVAEFVEKPFRKNQKIRVRDGESNREEAPTSVDHQVHPAHAASFRGLHG